jgi:hypothetical protein
MIAASNGATMVDVAGSVFPREEPRSSVSHAEVAVWQALTRGLPDGWRAWHSLRLRRENHWEGEGDFVIAVPDRGLLVLEVKGGIVELRDGRWTQNGRPMTRAPLDQAQSFVRNLDGALADRGLERPPYGVACTFPDVDFTDGPQSGDLAGRVLGPRQLKWLDQALPAVVERAVPPGRVPRSRQWLHALHEMWGETWVPTVSLADHAADAEARVVALAREQLVVLDAAAANPRAVVTGGAGSGKTLIARELCTRAAASGERVLYLCFTDALGHAVDRSFAAARAAGHRLEARPIRRFARELLVKAGHPVHDGAPDFWESASLTAACEALPPPEDRPDLVVIDESQDLDDGDWDLIAELVGKGSLWVLGDERQAFWRRRGIPDALGAGAIRLSLTRQHRNPEPIEALGARYATVGAASRAAEASAVRSGAVRVVEVAAERELAVAESEVTELVRRGARPRDIAILTLAGRQVSALLKRTALGPHAVRSADAPDAAQHLVADTFLRFKGLERPFVILVELDAGHASQYERRMHLAVTRATARLVILATPAALAADDRLPRPQREETRRP